MNGPLTHRPGAQLLLTLDAAPSSALDQSQALLALVEIATAANTLQHYAIHACDLAAAAGQEAQSLELGMIQALAKRITRLASCSTSHNAAQTDP